MSIFNWKPPHSSINIPTTAILNRIVGRHFAAGEIFRSTYEATLPARVDGSQVYFSPANSGWGGDFSYMVGRTYTCRTLHLAYDVIICKVLLTLAHFSPNLSVSTDNKIDGEPLAGQWKNAHSELLNDFNIDVDLNLIKRYEGV